MEDTDAISATHANAPPASGDGPAPFVPPQKTCPECGDAFDLAFDNTVKLPGADCTVYYCDRKHVFLETDKGEVRVPICSVADPKASLTAWSKRAEKTGETIAENAARKAREAVEGQWDRLSRALRQELDLAGIRKQIEDDQNGRTLADSAFKDELTKVLSANISGTYRAIANDVEKALKDALEKLGTSHIASMNTHSASLEKLFKNYYEPILAKVEVQARLAQEGRTDLSRVKELTTELAGQGSTLETKVLPGIEQLIGRVETLEGLEDRIKKRLRQALHERDLLAGQISLKDDVLPLFDALDRARDGDGLAAIRDQFARWLAIRGIDEIKPDPGTPYDDVRHWIDSTEPTDDPARHDRIARILTPGYLWNEKVVRKAKVITYGHDRGSARS